MKLGLIVSAAFWAVVAVWGFGGLVAFCAVASVWVWATTR